MSIVERFIEISNWPASRKTALLAGLAVPISLVNWVIIHMFLANSGTVDLVLLDKLNAAGVLVLAMVFAASLIADRIGKPAPWTSYMLVALYGSFIACILQGLGIWSTSLFALVPVAGMLATLYFGKQVGWFMFFCSFLIFVTVGVLQAMGSLPYAPVILDRTLDAQQSPTWIAGIMGPVLLAYVFGFALVLLNVAARSLQEARLQKAQRLIRRYVPSQLADKIINGEHSETFNPERAKLTIFFSDIEGFTDASDKLDAEDLASVLNEYLSEMSVIAERYGATINQFVGDGIMIFFGAPHFTNDKDHALRAVRMAIDMQSRMLELKDIWVNRGIEKPFRTRIGINTGHASVGDYGSEGRKVYSAIGVQTNIAARIQAQCEPGKILLSHSTWALVSEEIACAEKVELHLKGLHYQVRAHEVLA
jgi:class 3 adenylate cyclase